MDKLTPSGKFWITYLILYAIFLIVLPMEWLGWFLVISLALIVVPFVADYIFDNFSRFDDLSDRSMKQCRSSKDEHENVEQAMPHDYITTAERVGDK